jgi:hypothetical protein
MRRLWDPTALQYLLWRSGINYKIYVHSGMDLYKVKGRNIVAKAKYIYTW